MPDKYHYVEVMACPSGCLNGGGQVISAGQDASSASSSITKHKEILSILETQFHKELYLRDPSMNPIVSRVYSEWSLEMRRDCFYTSFNAVPSLDKTDSSSIFAAMKW
jgi:iron only hydrogenase large subunit-like protein